MSQADLSRPWNWAALLLVGFIAMALSPFEKRLFGEVPTEATSTRGDLVIIGGGLRHNNEAVYRQLIQSAGGVDQARFVVLPTASVSAVHSHEVCEELALFGLPRDRAEVLDCMESNASTATSDPKILEKVREATAVFLNGGDQRRLVRLLTRPDGSDTPLLAEIRKLHARGGLIAGSSAGASAQSTTMLAVSGLPDMMIDEGLDALDFGLTANSQQRGLLISRGFGFFQHGIVDQHFYQFRGRLGRLARATSETGVPLGFGVDENTAMVVDGRGTIRVIGTGYVTIIDPQTAQSENGPHGFSIRQVRLNVLSDGDSYDPVRKEFKVAQEKSKIVAEKVDFNGNFLINDLGGAAAVPFVLISGLAENQRSVQEAIAVKHHGDYSHGYRFVFHKDSATQTYSGIIQRSWTYTLLNLRLDISPIANGLRPSTTQAPRDTRETPEHPRLTSIAFRGLMPVDATLEFRPRENITRGEFAHALARGTHIPGAYLKPLEISDVDPSTQVGDEIFRVVSAGMMTVNENGQFDADRPLAPADAVIGLLQLVDRSGHPASQSLKSEIEGLASLQGGVSRAKIGLLLHAILKLP